MLEMGARFNNNLYVRTSFNPDNGNCSVIVEFKTDEGVVQTITGDVTWDE